MTALRTSSTSDTYRPAGYTGREPYTPVQELALILLRVVVAAVFLYAGTAKWAFWSAPMPGMSPLMHKLILFLSIVEPLGAVALLLGFLTRWAAAGLAIIMLGAVVVSRVTMHTPLFTGPQGAGLDYNFLLLAGCVALVAIEVWAGARPMRRSTDQRPAPNATSATQPASSRKL